nr:hypothetical protein NCPCFENI_01270 [Cupriavidus sp.]
MRHPMVSPKKFLTGTAVLFSLLRRVSQPDEIMDVF